MSTFAVTTTEDGGCVAFPDVCIVPGTPPVPTPFPNKANPADGKGAKKVKVRGKEILRKGDEISKSSGDEAGTQKGVMSGTNRGPAKMKAGCAKVKVEGKDCAHQTVMVGQNGSNANMPAGCHVKPSQSKVKVIGAGGGGGEVSKDIASVAGIVFDCSPTLKKQLDELKDKGWHIKFKEEGDKGGSCCKRNEQPPIILLDRKLKKDSYKLMRTLAHEVGHALHPKPDPESLVKKGMSGNDFVKAGLQEDLEDEGAAAINNHNIRKEVEEECGLDIGLGVSGEKEKAMNSILNGDDSDAEKRTKLAEEIKELKGSQSGETYEINYSRKCRMWAMAHRHLFG